MKVYVDELPKKCLKCPCFDRCGYMCKINKKLLDTVGKESADNSRDEDCPLQSLADYTKQVRKEVCEEIKQKIEKRNNGVRNANYSVEYKDGYSGCCCDFEDILDQIQGETK